MSIRETMLRAKAREIRPELKAARDVAAKAADEHRNMTADEQAVYDAAMAKARPILDALDAHRNDQEVEAAIRGQFAGIGGTPTGKTGQRLTFKGMAAGIATRMIGGNLGAKALAPSGATVVAQTFTDDPVALGRAATGLLDILPVTTQTAAEYAFLRQGTRTNNAAEVAAGDTKPTSVLGLTRVEQSLAVVAHLSEGIPRYWIADNAALEQFVSTELEYGLRVAVEAKVLADINATSGVQAQAWSTSIAETLRKSLTKLEVAGHTPAAIVVHPADFEAVELAIATTTAVEYRGLPYDAATRRLFGVPIATTVSQEVGTGHVLAVDAVAVDTDTQGVGVQWSESSNDTDFAQNMLRARCEGRFGTSVYSPLGVVVAALVEPEA